MRIAIVDDEDSVRRSVERLLRSAGMEVETFSSGRDFLKAAQDHHLHFLVLDLHMPAMTGFDVCEELKRSGIRMPVAIITGHDMPEYRAQAESAGVVAYLPKPIDDKVLLAAIASATHTAVK